jgi:ribosomal protein L37AE/L43A
MGTYPEGGAGDVTEDQTASTELTEEELDQDEAIANAADGNPEAWVPGAVADTYGAVPYVPALSTSHSDERAANCAHAGRFSPERAKRYIVELRRLAAEVALLRKEPACPTCARSMQLEATRGLWRCPEGCGGPATGELESERQEIERLRAENEKLLERLRSVLG